MEENENGEQQKKNTGGKEKGRARYNEWRMKGEGDDKRRKVRR